MEIKLKSAWDKLSMQEKALLIKLSVNNGVSSLKLIRDTYNLYANGGNLAHKKSGKELGESSSLNTPYTITGDTIQIHPVSLTNDTLTALPFTIYDRDKKNTIRRLEDNARKQTRQLYIKNYNQYASDINELNKTFLDVYGGFDNKKYKQIFKNTYSIPSELLQSNLLSVLDNNSTDSYRFGYTQESISGLKLLYVDLINDTKKLPSHTKTQLQNLISNFDWDRLHSFGEPAMNALADPTIATTPQEYLAQNAYDMMQGYAYADAYFNSQGFKDRIKNLNQELLYLNYQPELKNLTPIEVIEGDNGRYGLVSKEGVNFMAGYDNADSGGSWGLLIDNHFGVGAHEGAHHNKVYNTPDWLVNEDATNETSLYYSPHYKRNYRDIPTEILLILKPSNYRNTHDAEINESYSDLIETRALLEKLGIYKSTEAGQTFTEEMYDRYLNTEEGKNDRFLLLHNKQQVIDALNLIASNTNTTNPFETSNGMYLAAFGGPLSHKKSTGGPLYPFSFEKNPFLKTPVVRYDEGGKKLDASNPGGYTDEQLNKNYLIWKTYDPTGGLNFINYVLSLNFGNLARGEENEYWKEYLGLNSAVPFMNSNAHTEWDKQIEALKKQNGELASDFYGTTPRMDYNIQALADTLMLGNMVRNYEEYNKKYNLPHIETVTKAYEQAKNILNNPNKWILVDGEIPIGLYKYDPETSETNPLGMLANFGMKWVPEENALYMHDTYDFPNKVHKRTEIPVRPREMKIRSKISFDPTKGSWLLRSPVNYNTNIPAKVTK